jgi:hypothetical protein
MSNFAFLPYTFKDIAVSTHKAEGLIMRDSLAELDALFAALQHRAFRGEL